MNLNVERFLNRSFSVGPLLQFGVTGNLTQIGVSGQVKYWVNLSKALKLTAQGGLGFMHTDVPGSGTSLLVPLGVGFDYALNRNVSATATFLLNFTDINTSVTSPHVMPGLVTLVLMSVKFSRKVAVRSEEHTSELQSPMYI